MTWPNFFIVGAPKAGTTSMYFYLKDHQEIFMSPIKEPNFFSVSIIPSDYFLKPIRDEKKYQKLFDGITNEKVIGEATPHYLRDPHAPKLIRDRIPHAKILIILRNPVERTFSHYLDYHSYGIEKMPFLEAIQSSQWSDHYVEGSLYSTQVKRYFDTFGEKQVKVIFLEEMMKYQEETIKEVLDFLEVTNYLPKSAAKTFNKFSLPRGKLSQIVLTNTTVRSFSNALLPSSIRNLLREKLLLKNAKKPTMSDKERNMLGNLYYDDIQKLHKVIQRELPWKL